MYIVFLSRGLCLYVLLFCSSIYANSAPNLMVMAEDLDSNAIHRDSRVYKAVANAMNEQMHVANFDVFDELSIVSGGLSSKERRSDDELIYKLKSALSGPMIDIVVLVTIYARLDDRGHSQNIIASVHGRMLHVSTGKFLGMFETNSPRYLKAPVKCDKQCILETLADESALLAQDLGAILAEKLRWLIDETDEPLAKGYTLNIRNIDLQHTNLLIEKLTNDSSSVVVRPAYMLENEALIWVESKDNGTTFYKKLSKLNVELGLNAKLKNLSYTFNLIKSDEKKEEISPVSKDW